MLLARFGGIIRHVQKNAYTLLALVVPALFWVSAAIALMHSELSEALEAMRIHADREAVAEELADCCIRIFDYCGARDIDLENALLKKIEFNKTRPYRHGKKF